MPSIQCPSCGARIPLDSGFGPPGGKRFFCLGCDVLFGLTGGAEQVAGLSRSGGAAAIDLAAEADTRPALTA